MDTRDTLLRTVLLASEPNHEQTAAHYASGVLTQDDYEGHEDITCDASALCHDPSECNYGA